MCCWSLFWLPGTKNNYCIIMETSPYVSHMTWEVFESQARAQVWKDKYFWVNFKNVFIIILRRTAFNYCIIYWNQFICVPPSLFWVTLIQFSCCLVTLFICIQPERLSLQTEFQLYSTFWYMSQKWTRQNLSKFILMAWFWLSG